MTADNATAVRETDLYGPVHDYLVAHGYTVRSEVKGCDITATKDDDLLVVELKRNFSSTLLIQATDRQRVTDSVYVALPRATALKSRVRWRGIRHLLRRLELGLILVSFTTEEPLVQVAFHPLPFQRKRNKPRRRAILKEIAERSGDYNEGGSSRRGIVTAYRENVIMVACCLDRHGPLAPRQLRALGTGPKTQSILSSNFYRWFERVDVGLYALSAKGRASLDDYPELVAQFRKALDKSPLEGLATGLPAERSRE